MLCICYSPMFRKQVCDKCVLAPIYMLSSIPSIVLLELTGNYTEAVVCLQRGLAFAPTKIKVLWTSKETVVVAFPRIQSWDSLCCWIVLCCILKYESMSAVHYKLGVNQNHDLHSDKNPQAPFLDSMLCCIWVYGLSLPRNFLKLSMYLGQHFFPHSERGSFPGNWKQAPNDPNQIEQWTLAILWPKIIKGHGYQNELGTQKSMGWKIARV